MQKALGFFYRALAATLALVVHALIGIGLRRSMILRRAKAYLVALVVGLQALALACGTDGKEGIQHDGAGASDAGLDRPGFADCYMIDGHLLPDSGLNKEGPPAPDKWQPGIVECYVPAAYDQLVPPPDVPLEPDLDATAQDCPAPDGASSSPRGR